jgi:hypothetical protein
MTPIYTLVTLSFATGVLIPFCIMAVRAWKAGKLLEGDHLMVMMMTIVCWICIGGLVAATVAVARGGA